MGFECLLIDNADDVNRCHGNGTYFYGLRAGYPRDWDWGWKESPPSTSSPLESLLAGQVNRLFSNSLQPLFQS